MTWELVAAATKLRPDVIVADISMPALNGIDAVAQIRQAGVSSRVVFLTMQRDVSYARRAMEAGASGYILKHSALEELVKAIREALRGQTYVTPLIAGELLRSYREEDPSPSDASFLASARRTWSTASPASLAIWNLSKTMVASGTAFWVAQTYG